MLANIQNNDMDMVIMRHLTVILDYGLLALFITYTLGIKYMCFVRKLRKNAIFLQKFCIKNKIYFESFLQRIYRQIFIII